MRFVITERQYRLISEQAPPTLTSSNQSSSLQPTTNVKSGISEVPDISMHTVLMIGGIASAMIPYLGPFLSAGLAAGFGLADAKLYYDEGDTKMAGLVGLFAVIPGIGGLAAKLGLGKWGAKALGEVGKKIGLGAKLTAQEVQVANVIAQNRNLIQQEIAKLGAKAGINAAKQNVKKRLVRKAVVDKTGKILGKTAKFAGTKVAPYVGVAAAYNQGYDAVTGNKAAPSLEDLVKVDKQNISQANLQASKELDF